MEGGPPRTPKQLRYELLRRLKTQVARLKKEPEVLMEYALIIQDQLEAGIIEREVELEKAPRVHYLPHQAVIRKESTTTKVRVVYDASSREGKVYVVKRVVGTIHFKVKSSEVLKVGSRVS